MKTEAGNGAGAFGTGDANVIPAGKLPRALGLISVQPAVTAKHRNRHGKPHRIALGFAGKVRGGSPTRTPSQLAALKHAAHPTTIVSARPARATPRAEVAATNRDVWR